jgi:hypothetical protein
MTKEEFVIGCFVIRHSRAAGGISAPDPDIWISPAQA